MTLEILRKFDQNLQIFHMILASSRVVWFYDKIKYLLWFPKGSHQSLKCFVLPFSLNPTWFLFETKFCKFLCNSNGYYTLSKMKEMKIIIYKKETIEKIVPNPFLSWMKICFAEICPLKLKVVSSGSTSSYDSSTTFSLQVTLYL